MNVINKKNVAQTLDEVQNSNETVAIENSEPSNINISKFVIKISKKPVPTIPRGVLAE